MADREKKQEWVSKGFSSYITDIQAKLKEDTGKDFSRTDITAIIGAQKPVITVEVKKKGSLLDF